MGAKVQRTGAAATRRKARARERGNAVENGAVRAADPRPTEDPSELALESLELASLCALAAGIEAGELEPLRAFLGRADLAQVARMEPLALAAEARLDPERCARLAAAFALGRRVESARWVRGDSLRTADGVYRYMAPRVRGLERETLYVLLLDGKHRLKSCQRVSEGTLTSSLVHPREVFAPAVRAAAAAVIAVHNHPSGDPEPSAEDLAVTRRLADAGRLLGVPLLDHVVVAHGGFVSLRERIEL